MFSANGTLLLRRADANSMLFSIGTVLSSKVVQMKQGGVSGVTWSSLERSCTRSGDGLRPSRLSLEP